MQYVTRSRKTGLVTHQLKSTFCLNVKVTFMHDYNPETPRKYSHVATVVVFLNSLL